MHFVFCQISNKLINPDAGLKKTLSDEYYESLYSNKEYDGYYRPEHFWELPLWIGEATYALSDDHNVSLHVVTDVNKPLPRPFGVWDRTQVVYCFSVLDVNKAIVQGIIRRNSHCEFALGGYIDGARFILDLDAMLGLDTEFSFDVEWYQSIADLCYIYNNVDPKYGVDWSLFQGTRTIPRLTMSYGCSNRCSFCTVPNEVKAVGRANIKQQILAMRDLEFKLVYLNDKTFGQCHNSKYLGNYYDLMKWFNPDFRGFVVQTTCQEVIKRDANFWSDNHIVVVELGIETFNDNLLKMYKKPQNEKTIAKAVNKLFDASDKIDVIANVVLGFPGETMVSYGKTMSFLHYFPFYALNINTLAVYADSDLAKDLPCGDSEQDRNQLATTRTFWTAQEQRTFDTVSGLFYQLGMDKVRK